MLKNLASIDKKISSVQRGTNNLVVEERPNELFHDYSTIIGKLVRLAYDQVPDDVFHIIAA